MGPQASVSQVQKGRLQKTSDGRKWEDKAASRNGNVLDANLWVWNDLKTQQTAQAEDSDHGGEETGDFTRQRCLDPLLPSCSS